MAHRTNITQVPNEIEPNSHGVFVVDPVCGKQLQRLKAHHVLFRSDSTFYFCSSECKDAFVK